MLILGASSWIGYELIKTTSELKKNSYISGTIYNNQQASLPGLNKIHTLNEGESVDEYLLQEKPDILINFLRGETEDDYCLHDQLVKLCEESEIYYVYASSALAFDGIPECEHYEGDKPCSISEYGQFKVRCEERLLRSNVNYLILRFSSIHGWVPHKKTRSELFLEKLVSGESVIVDKGVRQNRLFAGDLVRMIIALIEVQATGIYHLGTEDSSTEVDYLRSFAHRFGYDNEVVVEGKERNVNLVVRPHNIKKLFGDQFTRYERDTLEALTKISSLLQYRNQ